MLSFGKVGIINPVPAARRERAGRRFFSRLLSFPDRHPYIHQDGRSIKTATAPL
jgi:hypothetical protein